MPTSFRAEHVGSLLRPPEYCRRGPRMPRAISRSNELRAVEDRAILQVLRKQSELGLEVVTDGEMRRGSWLTDMADAVEGFVPARVTSGMERPGRRRRKAAPRMRRARNSASCAK